MAYVDARCASVIPLLDGDEQQGQQQQGGVCTVASHWAGSFPEVAGHLRLATCQLPCLAFHKPAAGREHCRKQADYQSVPIGACTIKVRQAAAADEGSGRSSTGSRSGSGERGSEQWQPVKGRTATTVDPAWEHGLPPWACDLSVPQPQPQPQPQQQQQQQPLNLTELRLDTLADALLPSEAARRALGAITQAVSQAVAQGKGSHLWSSGVVGQGGSVAKGTHIAGWCGHAPGFARTASLVAGSCITAHSVCLLKHGMARA